MRPLIVALALLLLPLSAARAVPPSDALVMAWQIDDLIGLDPAEVFEFTGGEIAANLYDRLIGVDADGQPKGVVAESWSVSADGLNWRFRIRSGMRFHSGNPVTALDVAWSLRRVVLLDRGPALLLKNLGLDAGNVGERVAEEGGEVLLRLDRPLAPGFVLSCLGAGVGAVIDRREVETHAENGDLGHLWLRTHSAGSGPFKLKTWRPNELVVLERHDGYWRGAPKFAKIYLRHVAEPASQRLMLERGDVDLARNLTPEQLQAAALNAELTVTKVPKAELYYLALNQQNDNLRRPQVRQALKYLIDYEGIERSILRGTWRVHQSFLPPGFLGALEDKPFALDVAKAKALLAEAGLADGFAITMDTKGAPPLIDVAQAIQASFALANVRLDILPGDDKQTLTRYRARRHQIYIYRWGPDYHDPHSNAEAFASNPNNADDANDKTLAWRNTWDIPGYTRLTEAALAERDPTRRAALYQTLQRRHQQDGPFIFLFQDVAGIAQRKTVHGLEWGPSFDTNFYAGGWKE